MKNIQKIAALCLILPASGWASPLFEADPYRLLEIANQALYEKFPDLLPGSAPLSNDLYVYCEPAQPRKKNFLLDEEFKSCEASVVYDLSDTSEVSFFLDGKGGCLQSVPPGWAEVRIFSDGRAVVRPYKSRHLDPEVVDCSDEVVTHLAVLQEPVRVVDEPFRVDPNDILDTAFLAAIEKFPDLDPAHLDIEFNMYLFCDVHPNDNPRPQREMAIKPCVAEVVLMNRDDISFETREDNHGRCWETEMVPSIRVRVDSAGIERLRSGSVIEMDRERVACER